MPTWVSPRLWVAGEKLTAAKMNEISDDLNVLFPYTGGNKIAYSVSTTVLGEMSITDLQAPTGAVLGWSTASAPTGWLLCDGSAVNRTTYATLFALVGTTFGSGNGSTTFNLPDLRGRTIIGVDGAAGRVTSASTNGANADTLGGAGGAETHTLVTGEIPAHTHTYNQNAAVPLDNASNDGSYYHTNNNSTVSSGSTGGGGAHSNTQPWLALNYIIKA